MPIDNRVIWDSVPAGKGTKIKGKYECDVCGNTFEDEISLAEEENDKDSIWKAKTFISEHLTQHHHV
jgi:hypothetical protein